MMENTIYLIRHGKIYKDGNFDTLNEEGLQFAYDLPSLLDCSTIDFIAIVKGKNRCHETIRHIKKEDVKFEEYDKIDFLFLKPYYEALKYKTSVICYGYEEVGSILNELEIAIENKDELYEIILKINLEDKTYKKVPTGYSKTK